MSDARTLHDGCPEFDERLIDLAAEPFAPPDLEAHLATCAACRDALAAYRDAGRAISAAFTTLGGAVTPAPPAPPSPRPRVAVTLAAAALLVLAVTALLRVPPPPPPSVAVADGGGRLAVAARYDAIVSLTGPATARIEDGTSTFVIRDGRSIVETPIGALSCNDCEFTVQVRSCAAGSLPMDLAALATRCVTVSVAQGRLGTTILDQSLTMGPGQSITWPMTAECVPMLDARFPGLYQ